MSRTILAAALALSFCAAALADVTLHATSTGQGAGMSGQTTSVTYIKGLKMRTEAKLYILDTKKKEASVWDMGAFSEEMGKAVDAGGLPVQTEMSMKASGDSPVAAIMSRMGAITTTTVIDTVDTAALDDALFQVPANYALKQR